MKDGARAMVGRTVSALILTRALSSSLAHLFLVFTDGTYYELYSDASILPLDDAPQSIVGVSIKGVDIAMDRRTKASTLVLLGVGGTAHRFGSVSEIRTTSTLWTDGLMGALGHFPDDIIIAQYGGSLPE